MNHLSEPHHLHLQRNQVASFACDSTLMVRVKTGRVWLTAYDTKADHWIAAGESMVLPASQHFVLQAEDRFTSVELRPIEQSRAKTWLAMLLHFLRLPQTSA